MRPASPFARWYARMASSPASSPWLPGVGLQRDRVVAGDIREPALELADQLEVALHIGGRRERVDVGELRPGDRRHLGGRVELHRARAERDHAAVERVVLVGEVLEVAHHAGLGMMRVEHRMREVLARAGELRVRCCAAPAWVRARERASPSTARSTIRNSSAVVVSSTEMVTRSASTRHRSTFCGRGGRDHGIRSSRNADLDGVEELRVRRARRRRRSRASASSEALRLTWCAIRFSPAGPW